MVENENDNSPELNNINLKLFISDRLKKIMDYFSCRYEKEIAGLIVGEILPDRIVLNDLIIPEQEVSSASVDISGDNLIKMWQEFGKEKCQKIIGEWHSHQQTLGTFFSDTDDELYDKFVMGRNFSVFIVSSKGQHLIRIVLGNPFNITIDKVEYMMEVDENISQEMEQIIKDKVKVATYTATSSTNSPLEISVDKKSLKKLKKEINKKIKYFHTKNIVEIEKVEEETAHMVKISFPKIDITIDDVKPQLLESCKIIAKCKNDNEAKEFMVDVKDFLVNYEFMKDDEDEFEEYNSFIEAYARRDINNDKGLGFNYPAFKNKQGSSMGDRWKEDSGYGYISYH